MINFLYSLCTISKEYYLENYFAKENEKKEKNRKDKNEMFILFIAQNFH